MPIACSSAATVCAGKRRYKPSLLDPVQSIMERSHPSSGRSATPADINRNGRPTSIGIGGRHQSECPADIIGIRIYDTEHVPNLLQVPGVHSVTRLKGEPARFAIAGAVRELPAPSPIYTAIYEIDHPQVLESPEWAEAVERGRWPSEVRPHTSNRQHLLFKVQ